jgi:hypothetical protein
MLIFGMAFGYLFCWFFFPRKVEVEKEVIKTVTKEVPVEKEVLVDKYPDDYEDYLKYKKRCANLKQNKKSKS